MSRVDRLVARRMESPRKVNDLQKLRPIRDRATGKVTYARVPYHVQGDQWWRVHLADLVERRNEDGTHSPRAKRKIQTKPVYPKPEVVPRPVGMTRQMQRAAYRKACKIAGVPWR